MSNFQETICGTYKGNLLFAEGEIYIGKLDDKMHVEISYINLGVMHKKAIIKNIDTDSFDIVIDINGVDSFIHCKYRENEIDGIFEICGEKRPVSFTKIKSTYEFKEPYLIIPKRNIEILRENNSYEYKQSEMKLSYELNNKEVLAYLKEIGISTKNKSSLKAIEELLHKFCLIIHHDGANYTHSKEYGTINQIKWALEQGGFTNCRGISISFSGILRAYGFKSSYVTCRPYDEKDSECHVVCEVYIEELKKFIFIDPSMQVYFMKDNKILNLIEFKECISNGEKITYYENPYNDYRKFNLESYLAYFSKNLTFFDKCIDNCETKEAVDGNEICLAPLECIESAKARFEFITSNVNNYYQ